jgi:hypothetical protein
MKITISLKLAVVASVMLLATAVKINLTKEQQVIQGISEFSLDRSVPIIQEEFQNVRNQSTTTAPEVLECYKLCIASKYGEALKAFWKELGRICTTETDVITKTIYSTFITATKEEVTINGKATSCNDILSGSLMSDTDLALPSTQRKIRQTVELYFSPPRPPVDPSKGNVLYKFINERGSAQSDELIPKLNGIITPVQNPSA